jgi:tetratricopeptide (TPR) repeat protein
MKRQAICSLLLLLCAATVWPQARKTAADPLRKGNELMGRNQVDAAIAEYDRVIAADPRHADAYVKRGIARRAKGDLDNAIADYEKALELKPALVKSGAILAEPYFERGVRMAHDLHITAALTDLNRAIALHSGNSFYFYHRGQALLVAGRFAEAEADLNRVISDTARGKEKKTTFDALALVYRGYARLKQDKDATADFKQAEQIADGETFQLQAQLLIIEAKIREWKRREAERLRRTA